MIGYVVYSLIVRSVLVDLGLWHFVAFYWCFLWGCRGVCGVLGDILWCFCGSGGCCCGNVKSC